MSTRTFLGALAAAAIVAGSGPSLAGNYQKSCYKKVHHPAEYRIVLERVIVQQEQVYFAVSPAQYRIKREKVIIKPAQTIAQTIPAVTKTVHQNVVVRPASTRWEYQRKNGKKVLCEVHVPAKHALVKKQVIVRPARTVHTTIPAQYG